MMNWLRARCTRWLRIPPPPQAPLGHENTLLTFRAGERYYQYRVAVWWMLRVVFLLIALYLGAILTLVSLAVAAEVAPSATADAKKSLLARVDPAVLPIVLTAVAVIVLGGWLLHALVSWALIRLDWEMRFYLVTDRSLRIREGVWFVREMTMSFANVQNVSVQQGPMQKIFQVSDLIVESAGGGGDKQGHALHVGVFRGIEQAEEVKALILERLRKLKDAGLGDHDDTHESPETIADALRAVRDEARALRADVTGS